jgi:hypothetical protein
MQNYAALAPATGRQNYADPASGRQNDVAPAPPREMMRFLADPAPTTAPQSCFSVQKKNVPVLQH